MPRVITFSGKACQKLMNRFRRRPSRLLTILSTLSLLVLVAIAASAQSAGTSQPYFSDAALSPDGSEIAFVSGGDVWTVPASGGDARLLVSHPATESRPLYSPDGKELAFN